MENEYDYSDEDDDLDEGSCLVEKLQFVDDCQNWFETKAQRFNQAIGGKARLLQLGAFYQIPCDQIPQINVPETQRRLMQGYLERSEPNVVLADAVLGNSSVCNTLEELTHVNAGLRRFFPRRKNEEHDKKVKDMIELLGGEYTCEQLYTGVSQPVIGLMPLIMGSLLGLFGGIVFDIPMYLGGKESFPNGAGLMCLGGLLYGVAINFLIYDKNELPWNEAKYLDNKVKELF